MKLYMKQKVFSFKDRFYIKDEQGNDRYYVEGDFWSHDYNVANNGRNVASVHKAWFSWGDSYELDINNSGDEVLALAVVLAIDAVLYAEAAASGASS